MSKNIKSPKVNSEASVANLFSSRLDPVISKSTSSRLEPAGSSSRSGQTSRPPRGPRPTGPKNNSTKIVNQLEARINGNKDGFNKTNELAKRISVPPSKENTLRPVASQKLNIREFYEQSRGRNDSNKNGSVKIGVKAPRMRSRSRSKSPVPSRSRTSSRNEKVIKASSLKPFSRKSYRDRSPVTKNYRDRSPVAKGENKINERDPSQVFDSAKSRPSSKRNRPRAHPPHEAITVSQGPTQENSDSITVPLVSSSGFDERASISIRGAGSKACVKITNMDPATSAADLNSTLIDFKLPQCLEIQLIAETGDNGGPPVSKTAFIVFLKLREAETCHEFFNGLVADQKVLKSEVVPVNQYFGISIKNRHIPQTQSDILHNKQK